MSSSATVPFFKKPSAKIANARRRAAASRRTKVDSDKSDDDKDSNDDSASSSASGSDDESRQTALMKTSAKKRKIGGISDTITSSANGSSKTGVAAAADIGVGVEHKGSGSAALSNTTDITKKSAMYDEDFLLGKKKLKASSDEGEVLSGDAAEALEQQQQQQQQGIYRGNANYAKFITPREQATRKVGPMKSASNIRSTTVTDYQPDVCKDYKQTGFCGYGDSCKFVHMRENYKAGWQLDKEWEEVQRKKNKAA